MDQYKILLATILEKAIQWRFNAGGESGIYFLLDDKDVVYVGQATRMCYRMNAHAKSGKRWWRYFTIDIDDKATKDAVEAYYIGTFAPIYNDKVELVSDLMPVTEPGERKIRTIQPNIMRWRTS